MQTLHPGKNRSKMGGFVMDKLSDQTHEWNSNVSREKLSARHLNLSSYNAGHEAEEQAVTPPPYPPRAGGEMQAHVPHSKARVCSHLCVDSELTPHLQGEKQGEEAQEYEMSNLQEL